ncbi:hypothetical protein PSN45_004630 [Yamadazyma tenuis]|nr:hypothetical protein PSN45_004630 [Yamadazyma tenuis]
MVGDSSHSSFNPETIDMPPKPALSREWLKRRNVSQGNRQQEAMKTTDSSGPTSPSKIEKVTMDVLLSSYVKDISSEALTLQGLASVIDREVLEHINDFIKNHEPYIHTSIDHLDQVVNDYITTYADVEKVKADYNECKRAKEFADNDANSRQKSVEDSENTTADEIEENTSFASESSVTLNETNDSVKDEEGSEGQEFDFPLTIGPAKLRSQKELSSFLRDCMSRIEMTKRTFPLPGQKPEIFSGDELCKFLVYRRPFKLNTTRINLERFGQGLLDLKLIVGTGLVGSKRFKSEGMWFEWSELAEYVSKYEGSTVVSPPSSLSSAEKPKMRIIDEQTSKQVNEIASQTGKKFNDMFRSMKISILHTNYPERLEKLEEEYNEKYYELYELKYLIEYEVRDKTQYLEKFEKMKIGLIYQSLSKLSELIYNFSLKSTTRLRDFASNMLTNLNNPQNYENDYHKLLDTFSTGIYSPSILSPDNFKKNSYSTTQANNNFQNLKLQFNLYKDIPLQLQLFQTDKENELLSFASLPFFIYQLTRLIENKEQNLENLKDSWESVIDHRGYWHLQEEIIEAISEENFENITISDEDSVQQKMIEKIIALLNSQTPKALINFYKNWLLQIADSLIPCSVYDSLIHLHGREDAKPVNHDELVKILSSIPRANVSALVFLLEHISMVYGLSSIPSFGFCDDFPDELKPSTKESEVKEAVHKLNSMDAIGAVPFMHLIFRPSPIRSAGGLKPPLQVYNSILEGLLDLELRCDLFNNLVSNEKNYIERKQQERNNLGLQKKVSIPLSPRKPPIPTIGIMSPKALSASDSFSLRPFHTKVTPAPSPSASPRHLSRESHEHRDRSVSGTFLPPAIDVEFAED